MGYPFPPGVVQRTQFDPVAVQRVRDESALLGKVVDAAVADLRDRARIGQDMVAALAAEVSDVGADATSSRDLTATLTAEAASARQLVARLVAEATAARGIFQTVSQRLDSIDGRLAALEAVVKPPINPVIL